MIEHLRGTLPATIERLEGFLKHVKNCPDPTPEDVKKFFFVPMESSEGFVLELKCLVAQLKKVIQDLQS